MTRPYTGFDGNASGRRAGTEKLIQLVTYLSGGALWNNGSWVVRPMRGKSTPSVHGTGRAFDISWRKVGDRGSGRYGDAARMMDFLVTHADALRIEAIYDYHPAPFGRGWKCDRGRWTEYSQRAFDGAPGGDWFHVEIAPERADDPGHYDRVIRQVFTTQPTLPPKPTPVTPVAPSKPTPPPANTDVPRFVRSARLGSRGVFVERIQQRLGITADGVFGAKTEAAVKAFQKANPSCGPVDGVVGRRTWGVLFGI